MPLTRQGAREEFRGPGRRKRAGPDQRRRGRAPAGAIQLNMAPMIDMTFLLFSFVLVTSNFEPREGILASKMPEDAGAPTVSLPFSPIVVRLNQIGPKEDEFTISVDRFAGCPQTLADLPEFLRGIHGQPGFDQDTPVVIVADDTVRWDHVVNCWNAALRAGCKNIAFAEP